jgi:probable F420-dependent oxidoreductase
VSSRSFRFGLQLTGRHLRAALATAQRAEVVGFDVVHTSDHVGPATMPPLTPLAAIAGVTERVRLCPLVINNDFHHPVLLARDVLALDALSGGRMELGIGAGHAFTEYAELGLSFDPARVRKARLAESVELLRLLLAGDTVTHAGVHYELHDVRVGAPTQDRIPILVGVNGPEALAHAAAHADVVGLTMLGPTRADGQHHDTRWEADRLDATVAHIRAEATAAGTAPALHALVQAVIVTDDRETAAAWFVDRGYVPTVADALATPFLAIGTHAQIAEHLYACRERWGISYFSVRDLDAFAPVVELTRRAP